MSENPIVMKNETHSIYTYTCPTCLKTNAARRESDYYLKNATECCVVKYAPKRTPKNEPFDGPCFDEGGSFYMDVEDARDQGVRWVTKAEFVPYELNIGNVINSLLEDHHEDASPSDLQGLGDLELAIKTFNDRQKSGSYYEGRQSMKIPYTKTFAMVKPCAFDAGKTEEIVSLISDAGYTVEQRKTAVIKRKDARDLYAEHREKSHFNDLVDFTISGPVELMIISGGDSTPDDFRAFAMEHIRPKYTETQRRNGIHTSDNPDSAMREIEIFESYFS